MVRSILHKFGHVWWQGGPCTVRSKLNKFEHVQGGGTWHVGADFCTDLGLVLCTEWGLGLEPCTDGRGSCKEIPQWIE